jgi:hypothetical protein
MAIEEAQNFNPEGIHMKAFLLAVWTFIHERVWLSKKSTILGILVYALGEVIIYFQGPAASPYARLVAGLVAAPFLAWKDKASPRAQSS